MTDWRVGLTMLERSSIVKCHIVTLRKNLDRRRSLSVRWSNKNRLALFSYFAQARGLCGESAMIVFSFDDSTGPALRDGRFHGVCVW